MIESLCDDENECELTDDYKTYPALPIETY